jgi:hypothetical protein
MGSQKKMCTEYIYVEGLKADLDTGNSEFSVLPPGDGERLQVTRGTQHSQPARVIQIIWESCQRQPLPEEPKARICNDFERLPSYVFLPDDVRFQGVELYHGSPLDKHDELSG